jgi:hypothetical protein
LKGGDQKLLDPFEADEFESGLTEELRKHNISNKPVKSFSGFLKLPKRAVKARSFMPGLQGVSLYSGVCCCSTECQEYERSVSDFTKTPRSYVVVSCQKRSEQLPTSDTVEKVVPRKL